MPKTMFPTNLMTTQMPSAKAMISATASAAATAVLLRSLARDYLPHELRAFIFLKLRTLINSFSSEFTLVIEEDDNLNHNLLFKAAELYLEGIIPPDAKRLRIARGKKDSKFTISLEKNQEIVDTFDGVTLKWKFMSKQGRLKYLPSSDHSFSTPTSENRFFELSFHKKHKDMVIDVYLDHVIQKWKEMKERKKSLKLFTLKHDRIISGRGVEVWQSVNLDHPATFDTLAMDTELKKEIMEDLERFVKGKEFYRRVGKAWKRGYLLFGPPGTGKSSLVAAMANYLQFDIYDLELKDLRSNSDLRKLMISTANKSILVVEDIDCSIELQNRLAEAKAMMSRSNPRYNPEYQVQVTLSGLLNFIDGLWSSCGDERIIVFTTNHKEKLDSALLRPGRMDVHVHMSYCTPCGFRMLAMNYLGISEHPLFMDVEHLIEVTKVTPAEVGEQLMKSNEPETALTSLIEFLKCKKIESEKKAEEDRNKPSNEESGPIEGEGAQERGMNKKV